MAMAGLRRLAPLAALLGLLLASCGTAAPPGATHQAAKPASGAQAACSPASITAGFCLVSKPDLYCCSAAYTGWSHIYAGATVDVRGRAPLFPSGKPEAKDVFIVNPSGRRMLLPVDAHGAFSRRVRFSVPGVYRIGLVASGPGTPWSGPGIRGIPFEVAYRAVAPAGATLGELFPAARSTYRGIVVLAAPVDQASSWRVRFLDAQGRPAARAAIEVAGRRIRTDAAGYATLTYQAGPRYALDELYPGLFVQTYSRVAIAQGALTGLPRYAQGLGPAAVRVLTVRGEELVDVQDFLLYGVADIFQGSPAGVAYDAQAASLTIVPVGGRLDTRTGVFRAAQGDGRPAARLRLHPVVAGDQVYLPLPDLARILNLFAWARPEPDGSLLFSTFEVP